MTVGEMIPPIDLGKCGEFADDPVDGLFFHGFPNAQVMTKRLSDGTWGDNFSGTSVGVTTSQIPYMNVVWFMPKRVDLYPVFYPYPKQKQAPECEYTMLKEFIGTMFGIGFVDAEVSQWAYRKENEWYATKKINLKSIDVLGVVWMAKHGPPAKLLKLCERNGWPLSRWGE